MNDLSYTLIDIARAALNITAPCPVCGDNRDTRWPVSYPDPRRRVTETLCQRCGRWALDITAPEGSTP